MYRDGPAYILALHVSPPHQKWTESHVLYRDWVREVRPRIGLKLYLLFCCPRKTILQPRKTILQPRRS